MAYTMKDFQRDYVKEHLHELTPQELVDVFRALPAETLRAVSVEVLQALPEEEIRQLLERAIAVRKAPARRPLRRK